MYIIVGVRHTRPVKTNSDYYIKNKQKSKHLAINYLKNYDIDLTFLRPVILRPKK